MCHGQLNTLCVDGVVDVRKTSWLLIISSANLYPDFFMEFPNFLAIYFKFCRTLSVLNVLAAVVHLISAVIQFVVSVIHHCQTQHNYTTHLTLCPISSSKSFIKHKEPKC